MRSSGSRRGAVAAAAFVAGLAALSACAPRAATRQPGRPQDISGGWIGNAAPGFTLPDAAGKPVDVGAVLGKQPVVLVFYRGVW